MEAEGNQFSAVTAVFVLMDKYIALSKYILFVIFGP